MWSARPQEARGKAPRPGGCCRTTVFSFFPVLNAAEEKPGAVWSALSGGRPRGVPPKACSADSQHAWELQLLCKSWEDTGSLFAAGLMRSGMLQADGSISQSPLTR